MVIDYVYDLPASLYLLVLALLVLGAFYFLFRNRISFDESFLKAILPWAIAGAGIRSLTDKGLLPYGGGPLEAGYWTHTPGLWLAGGIVFSVLLGVLLWKKHPKPLTLLFQIGTVLAVGIVLAVLLTPFPDQAAFLGVLALAALALFAWLWLARWTSHPFLTRPLNTAAFAANALDGAASLMAFGILMCMPKHQLTGEWLGVSPVLFVVGKILFILLYLLAVEFVFQKVLRNPQAHALAVIFITLLSVITGVRAWFFVGSGFCTP